MTYEVIATLGPASDQPAIWAEMLAAGASGFRLNTSHLTLAALEQWLESLLPFLAAREPRPALALDLQGSKWRLGRFTPAEPAPGERLELILAAEAGGAGVLPVPHADFFRAAAGGGEISLNDARVRLQIEAAGAERLLARVVQGGPLAPGKGITLPGTEYRSEALNEKDRAILELVQGQAGVRAALSYVRDAHEMARYRALIGPQAYLIAKIERGPALESAAAMLPAANELWLCRGDLGAELGLAEMAAGVHHFHALPPHLPVPVLMAGQVLEHMTAHPTPTRSEVCYLYDTLQRGYRGFVLSDETAIGHYPIESCQAAALFKL